MSSLKRSRTEWGRDLHQPRDKRAVHEFEPPGYGYEEQIPWQAWSGDFENVHSVRSSIFSILPDANAQSDNSTPSLQGPWQRRHGFDNSPYQVDEHMVLSSGKEYNFDLSIPGRFDQNEFEGLTSTNFSSHIPMESFFGIYEAAPTAVNVCYGSVGYQKLSLQIIHVLSITAL
jgi:hypothetical protein